MNRIVIALLALAAMPGAVFGQEKSLSGSYEMGGKTLIDPPSGEPRDTHFRVVLAGTAAQDLYRNMKVAAKPNDCGDKGSLLKTIGPMQCERAADGKRYTCSFAIDIANQRITGAAVC